MKSTTQMIPLSAIEESADNARTIYDPIAMKQLADSITLHGLLEPICIRPKVVDGKKVEGKFVCVFGHRRLRAMPKARDAEGAALKEIRCEVREATDEEVVVLQDVENHQRVNLHALERSAGHQAMKAAGKSIEEIAKATSTSEATVRDSLKIGDLVGEAAAAFRTGKVDFSKAIIIAKVPPVLQPAILKWALTPYNDAGDLPAVRELKEIVDREFILDLKKAQFDIKDASLVPAAGACTTCPKRTGAQPGLFDGYKPDLCTDRPCNDLKTETSIERLGDKALPMDEAREIFWPHGGLRHDSGYVKAEQAVQGDPQQRKYGELMAPEIAEKLALTTRNPQDGKVVVLFKAKAAENAVKKAVAAAQREAEAKVKAREQKRTAKAKNVDVKEVQRKEKFEDGIRDALTAALVAAFEKEGPSVKALRFLLEKLVGLLYLGEPLFDRRGLKMGPYSSGRTVKAFAKHFGAAKADVLTGLLFEIILKDENSDIDEEAALMVAAGELLKVNLKKIEIDLREAEAAAQAKKKPEAKDSKPAKKKAA